METGKHADEPHILLEASSVTLLLHVFLLLRIQDMTNKSIIKMSLIDPSALYK